MLIDLLSLASLQFVKKGPESSELYQITQGCTRWIERKLSEWRQDSTRPTELMKFLEGLGEI